MLTIINTNVGVESCLPIWRVSAETWKWKMTAEKRKIEREKERVIGEEEMPNRPAT